MRKRSGGDEEQREKDTVKDNQTQRLVKDKEYYHPVMLSYHIVIFYAIAYYTDVLFNISQMFAFLFYRCSIMVNDSVTIYLKVVDREPTGDTGRNILLMVTM